MRKTRSETLWTRDALERLDGVDDLGRVLGVARRAGEVDDETVGVGVDDVERRRDAAALGDLDREGPDDRRVGAGVDPHRDRVGSSGGAGTLDRLSHAPHRPTIREGPRTSSEDRSVTFVRPGVRATTDAVTPVSESATRALPHVPPRSRAPGIRQWAGDDTRDAARDDGPGGASLTRPEGLTAAEVAERVSRGAVNQLTERTSRSIGEIVRANVLTRFNAILGALFALVMVTGSFADGLFGIVLVVNSAIGIVQEYLAQAEARPAGAAQRPDDASRARRRGARRADDGGRAGRPHRAAHR